MQNSTFGRRVSQPFADTSASSPTTLPIKIERDIGIKASTLFGAVLWAIFVTTLGYARTNGTVPIVYDVNRPATSGLNFRNRVFAKNPVSSMFDFLGIFGGIEALIMALFLASLLPTILKARKAAD